MLTPQEVASHSFVRASFGGYSMAMVDEFLDTLTEDYTALYNDNAILKNKLKVLSDTVEEYRATDTAMRKALLAAQQMADAMVSEAEQKKQQLIGEAEQAAAQRVEELKQEIAAEEYRLQQAKETTAAYVGVLNDLHRRQGEFLDSLDELVPPAAPAPKDDPSAEIEASLSALYQEAQPQQPESEAPEQVPEQEPEAKPARAPTRVSPVTRVTPVDRPAPEPESDELPELDEEVTKRFEDLQFGKDYRIE